MGAIQRQWQGLATIVAIGILGMLSGCGGDSHVEPPAAAPPATTTRVDVSVIDAAAAPIAGVQVAVVGGAAAATTAADGSASFELPAPAPLLLKFSKAGYTDNFKRVAFGAGSTAAMVQTSLRPRDAAQGFDSSAGGRLDARDGASVELPAGALIDTVTGAAVSGAVEIALTPINVASDELRAFPGSFSGIDGNGQMRMIATYGTTEFMLTQAGRRLDLAPGRTATIELPIYTPFHTVGVPVVVGDVIPLWSLDEASGIWKQEGTGTVVASPASPTGLAMRASVGHFSWWNCDVSVDDSGRLDLDISMPDSNDGNPYRLDSSRQGKLEGRAADSNDLRQQLVELDLCCYQGPFSADRKHALGATYHGPRGLKLPTDRRLALTACALIQKGDPGVAVSGMACGTVHVKVSGGETVTVTIPLVPDEAWNLPVVTTQPRSATVDVGATATFSVAAGRPFGPATAISYQWTKNSEPIAGATSASYVTPPVVAGDDLGRYAVVVTAPAGITLSNAARLFVNAPPPPPPPPNAGADRWVDAATGSDANPGSETLPLRTISAAIAQVRSGGTIWLHDGIWTAAIDPAISASEYGLNCVRAESTPIVAGTTIRAVNPGRVTIRYASGTGICVGDTQVRGVRLEAEAPGTSKPIFASVPGASVLNGVSFAGGQVFATAGARLTIEPGGLASYGDLGDAGGRAIGAFGTGTEVVVNGGAFDQLRRVSTGDCNGSFFAMQSARLTLRGVTASIAAGDGASSRAYGVGVCTGATVALFATTLRGFTPGAAVTVSQDGSLEMAEGSALIGNELGIEAFNGAAVSLGAGSTIQGSGGSGIRIASASRPMSLTMAAGSSVRDGAGHGIQIEGLPGTPPTVEIAGAQVSGNALSGVSLLGQSRCRIRDSVLTTNLQHGLALANGATCDLGTAASPGGNLFSNTGPGLSIEGTTQIVMAAGNTWKADQQGADAQGRYPVPAGQTVLEILGPTAAGGVTTGANYRLGQNTRLQLAQQ